jgi:hypothetical protein
MGHDVRMERWRDGSPRRAGWAIPASLPGNPAFSMGLVGLTIWFFLLMCGCSGTGRTVILRPPESNVRYSSVLVTEDGSNRFVLPEVSRDFRTALETYLCDRGPFVRGPELRIVYRITGYPSSGEVFSFDRKETIGTGLVTAEVKFYNFVEQEIASIRAEGDARDAGRIDMAIKECARQVASFIKQNFR